MIGNKIWVVLGECGEYSDRHVGVSGVFLTEPEARAHAEERADAHRAYAQWEYLCSSLDATPDQASLPRPPEPPYEWVERSQIVECEIGQKLGANPCA